MKVSIIIVSYNRKSFLENTIKYCLNQSYQNYEIIVVDASEKEFQQSDLFIDSCRPKLKYIQIDEVGNISKQRNLGIKVSTGDYLLFLDDDVKFNSTLLEVIVLRFNVLRADALSGLIEAKHRMISKEVKVDKSDPMLYLGQPSFHQNDFLVQTYLISAACFAAKRTSLLSIGCFDEQLNGTFDDSDVGIRLTNKGFLVYHDNLFRVYHFAEKNSGSRSSKLGPIWKYTNICYLQMKHFYRNNPNDFYFRSMLYFLTTFVFYLKPFKLIKEIFWFKKGFEIAKLRIKEGPKYLNL
jgi:GT2 family glycosyltransferase